jgi:hypothetical protein
MLHRQGEIAGACKGFVDKGLAHHLGACGQTVLKGGIGGVCMCVCHIGSSGLNFAQG